MLGIIDLGVGSVRSVQASLAAVDIPSDILSIKSSFDSYNRLIIPGVGHFSSLANLLDSHDLKTRLIRFTSFPENRLLGICLGMQILFDHSDECPKGSKGLSLFPYKITKLCSDHARVPHVGWSPLMIQRSGNFLSPLIDLQDFYFVHSYALSISPSDTVIFDEFSTTSHGRVDFVSSFRRKNIYGCQFHPEKSSIAGHSILKAFVYN